MSLFTGYQQKVMDWSKRENFDSGSSRPACINVVYYDHRRLSWIGNNSRTLSPILIKFLLICSQWIIRCFWRQSIWTSTWRCFKHALLIKKPLVHCVVRRASMTSSIWRHGQAGQQSDPRAFNKGLHDKDSRILRPISIKLFSIHSEWIGSPRGYPGSLVLNTHCCVTGD